MKIKLILLALLISSTATAQNTESRSELISPTSHTAIVGSPGVLPPGVSFIETFEGLAIGDLNGQNGWFAQFGNWEVDNSNPFTGTQNMFSISDGLGQTFAVSQTVTPGVTGIHAATAFVSMDNNAGVSWEFIPQAAVQGFVVTRIVFDGAGSIFALSNTNGGEYLDTGASAPSGYFRVAVVLEEAAGIFTLFINNDAVFSAPAFGTVIDNIAFLSGMEVANPTFFADDLAISDNFMIETVPVIDP